MIEKLEKIGWNVKSSAEQKIPDIFSSRYGNIPKDVRALIGRILVCENCQQTKWFVSAQTINEETEDSIHWNEFELISLESADGDEDEIISGITTFQ